MIRHHPVVDELDSPWIANLVEQHVNEGLALMMDLSDAHGRLCHMLVEAWQAAGPAGHSSVAEIELGDDQAAGLLRLREIEDWMRSPQAAVHEQDATKTLVQEADRAISPFATYTEIVATRALGDAAYDAVRSLADEDGRVVMRELLDAFEGQIAEVARIRDVLAGQ